MISDCKVRIEIAFQECRGNSNKTLLNSVVIFVSSNIPIKSMKWNIICHDQYMKSNLVLLSFYHSTIRGHIYTEMCIITQIHLLIPNVTRYKLFFDRYDVLNTITAVFYNYLTTFFIFYLNEKCFTYTFIKSICSIKWDGYLFLYINFWASVSYTC